MCILRYRDLSGGGMQGRLLANVVAGREALRVVILWSGGLCGFGGWEVVAGRYDDFVLGGFAAVDGGEGPQ
jgi:hypothetical protein